MLLSGLWRGSDEAGETTEHILDPKSKSTKTEVPSDRDCKDLNKVCWGGWNHQRAQKDIVLHTFGV